MKIKELVKKLLKHWVWIVATVLVSIYHLLFFSVLVSGESMVPTLHSGQFGIVSRHANIDRFDIVVTNKHNKTGVPLIKRVIGMPGEKVEIVNNEIYVNNRKIDVKFKTNGNTDDLQVYVKDGEYFLLGDNRSHSTDSREIGNIKARDISGVIIWK